MDQCGVVSRGVEVVYVPQVPDQSEKNVGGPPSRGIGRWALGWGFVGSLLSAVGFVALSLFEQYNTSLNELQHDLKHFNEISSEFVKKEQFKRVIDKVAECNKELQTSSLLRAQLEKDLETSQKERHDAEHELQLIRERLASVEGRQSAPPVVFTSVPDKK